MASYSKDDGFELSNGKGWNLIKKLMDNYEEIDFGAKGKVSPKSMALKNTERSALSDLLLTQVIDFPFKVEEGTELELILPRFVPYSEFDSSFSLSFNVRRREEISPFIDKEFLVYFSTESNRDEIFNKLVNVYVLKEFKKGSANCDFFQHAAHIEMRMFGEYVCKFELTAPSLGVNKKIFDKSISKVRQQLGKELRPLFENGIYAVKAVDKSDLWNICAYSGPEKKADCCENQAKTVQTGVEDFFLIGLTYDPSGFLRGFKLR